MILDDLSTSYPSPDGTGGGSRSQDGGMETITYRIACGARIASEHGHQVGTNGTGGVCDFPIGVDVGLAIMTHHRQPDSAAPWLGVSPR